MAVDRQRVIDRQVIPTDPGSIREISKIANPQEKKLAILDRKVRAQLMRTQLQAMGQGPTGWAMLEVDVRNTRARIAERAQRNGSSPMGEIDIPVHLNWAKIDRAAREVLTQTEAIPAPYAY